MSVGRQILKNTFSLTAAELAGKGLAIIFTIYLIRVIGPANNGVFTLAKSFVQGLLVLVWLGFEQVGVREVARDRSQMQYYVGSVLSIRLTIATTCYILLVAGLELFADIGNIDINTRIVAYIYGLLLFGNAVLLNWVFQAIERMHIIAIRSVLVNLLNLLGLIIFVRHENDLITAVWIIVISMLLNSAWMLIYYIKSYGMPKLNFNIPSWGNMFWQSARVGFVFLIVTFYSIIGVQVLSYYHGDVQTGIYGAAFQIIVFLLIPAGILQGAFFPQFAKTNGIEERNKIVSRFVVINLIAGVIMSFSLYVFSPAVVAVLGEKYAESQAILKYLSLTVLIQYISTSFMSPLIAWNNEKIVIYANLAGLAANIIFNFLLIPQYGYIGAAIATIVCELAVMIVIMFIYRRLQSSLFIKNLLSVIMTGIPAFLLGYTLIEAGMNIYLAFIINLAVFLGLILLLKIIKISEIKSLISR
ncbi:MAG: flippase [Candidatus Kapabacteria bacterium]|nr:flippase [Ignavibacteriota bacterium]MCW5886269.1 flippase [Candidatus Kapabacteria bacterium]